jgi:hypothetical protein
MTGEELIRDVWPRWNAGERDLDAESFDPEFEIHSALAHAWEILIDSIEEDRPGSFLAQGSIRARGCHSGVGPDQPAGWRIDLRGGRILRVRNFIGPEAAAQASLS